MRNSRTRRRVHGWPVLVRGAEKQAAQGRRDAGVRAAVQGAAQRRGHGAPTPGHQVDNREPLLLGRTRAHAHVYTRAHICAARTAAARGERCSFCARATLLLTCLVWLSVRTRALCPAAANATTKGGRLSPLSSSAKFLTAREFSAQARTRMLPAPTGARRPLACRSCLHHHRHSVTATTHSPHPCASHRGNLHICGFARL